VVIRSFAAGVCLLFCHALAAQSQSEELETVLVTGEVPGPGLWKVSRDGHVLWILGSYRPLPKDMKWRANEVERRVAESQEVIYPGGTSINPDIGIFRALTLLPALLKAGKNPDGATLKDVLPPQTYARWRVLKDKYIGGDDDVERWRPAVAVDILNGAALKKGGLGYSVNVASVVNRIAKQKGIPVHADPLRTRKIKLENPRGMLKSAQKMKLPDVECFARGLDFLEPQLQTLKLRANAWARGDIASLREASSYVTPPENCMLQLQNALISGEIETPVQAKRAIDEMARLEKEARHDVEAHWLFTVRAALSKNRSTFAVLPLSELLRPDGFLTKLRDLGYEVESPS
jgi:hypothetical protein